MKSYVAIFLVLHFIAVNAKFTWTSCAPSDAVINVQNVNVGPDPIIVPGDLDISISGNSTAPISHSALHVSIKRKTFLGEIPIPCLSNIGSCTYLDICTLVDQMINENWMGITTGIATEIKTMLSNSGLDASQCPQPPQSLSINHQTIHLPEIPAALSHFAALKNDYNAGQGNDNETINVGDYHAHITLEDSTTHKVNLCIDALFTMKEKECTGLLCIFG